jgi:uncharacterized protein (DUF983 family)
MTSSPKLFTALGRGFTGRCPCCGKGRLFRAYLKVVDACAACGHPLGAYRADDGPAYFTILIVGHLVIGPLLFVPYIWQGPLQIVLPLTLIPIAVLTLVLLPRIKGAFVGLLASLKTTGEHAPGGELAASEPGGQLAP